MAHGQDQGNGNGPFDGSKTEVAPGKLKHDEKRSLEIASAQLSFHCCACYEKAVAYDHATIEKELMEQGVRTASDIVLDAKYNKEQTEIAGAFVLDFVKHQHAKLKKAMA